MGRLSVALLATSAALLAWWFKHEPKHWFVVCAIESGVYDFVDSCATFEEAIVRARQLDESADRHPKSKNLRHFVAHSTDEPETYPYQQRTP